MRNACSSEVQVLLDCCRDGQHTLRLDGDAVGASSGAVCQCVVLDGYAQRLHAQTFVSSLRESQMPCASHAAGVMMMVRAIKVAAVGQCAIGKPERRLASGSVFFGDRPAVAHMEERQGVVDVNHESEDLKFIRS